MSEPVTCNDINIQINIVLEESLATVSDKQTVRMVGFVMIDDAHIKLSNLRRQIDEQLDDEQLQIIGLNFKFLKKNFPVSSKQETSIQMDNICMKSTGPPHTFVLSPKTAQNSFLLHKLSPIQDAHSASATSTEHHQSSNPQPNKNGLIIKKDTDEKTNIQKQSEDRKENASLNLTELQPFDALPHHYQYISSHLGISSPIMNSSFISANSKSLSPDIKDPQNEEAFPKFTMCTANASTFSPSLKCIHVPNKSIEEITYSVMVRACHRVLSRASSDPIPELHSFLGLETKHKSLSVFAAFDANDNDNNKSNICSPNKIKGFLSTKSNNKETSESSLSPKPIGFTSYPLAATASFITSYPLSPKLTRLETQHNEKLPRIRANSSNEVNLIDIDTEIDSILKNAMVTHTQDYVNVEDEGSLTISIDENTMLQEIDSLSRPKPSDKTPNGNVDTPPQTFLMFGPMNTQRFKHTQRNTDSDEHNQLCDDNIKCKFTVIGSPALNIEHDNEANHQEHTGHGNVRWEFDKATDLIKGLGGVHHSSTNPLWIDLVCDRQNFINIAEHIRPSIHNLTIEDCLTIDCREKLEIFNDYLYICIKTWRHIKTSATHTINILIFKSMIITYHLGHNVTNNVINESRFILYKKFGNICPSPSWVGHTIIDNVIDKMMPEVEARVREVETCEQFVFKLCNESQNELLHRMQNVRSWMVLYRSRLWPKSTITHNLLNNHGWRKDFLCDVPLAYWRDINDHVARMVDLLELGTHTLESIQNMFVAKISLEMTQQSNSLASVGGKLAGVGAVFLPLTVITGIWGMNCRVPFQYSPEGSEFFDDDLYGFIIVMLVMLFTSIFTWKCVNKKGWVDPEH